MPAFDYSAYNVSGNLVSGVISADSERQARRLLKDKKLLPSALSEVGQKSSHKGSKPGRKARVDNLDLSLLLHQQAILIQSGLPLEESLRMTIEQAETDKQLSLIHI